MRLYKALTLFVLVIFISNTFVPSFLMAETPPAAPVQGGGDTLGKDVALMAIYGTMSGMIIGAASLAFVSRPLTKLRSIAIGASLGLYVGLLLGGLVVLDRNLGSGGGGSIFDVPIEEEVPIVHLKDKNFKFSFPTIIAMNNTLKKENELKAPRINTVYSASIFKMTF